jgi:hypothetical protein
VRNFPEQHDLTKEDYVIICGDFGIWNKNSQKEIKNFQELEKRKFTTLFIDGNHENFDQLSQYPVKQWNGGLIHEISPSILHLMRGQVYTIHGKKFFTFGGSRSQDVSDGILDPDDPKLKHKIRRLELQGKFMYRVNHISWWAEEMPSLLEYAEGIKNLDAHNWKVDYVITHSCPAHIQDQLSNGRFQQDDLTRYLENISHKLKFKQWFFGHYHSDAIYSSRYFLFYYKILNLKVLSALTWGHEQNESEDVQ